LFGDVNYYSDIVVSSKLNVMNLKPNSLIFNVEREQYDIPIFNEYQEKKSQFINEKGYRKLVFSTKSFDNLDNYFVSGDKMIPVMRSLPNRTDIILLSEDYCLKYKKTDTDLFLLIVYGTSKKYYDMFLHIDLETEKMDTDDFELNLSSEDRRNLYTIGVDFFLRSVTYLELTNIKLSIIEGGKKSGDIMKGNRIKNETKTSVIQVNTNWNTRLIRTNSTTVRGHWRLQPYGKGMCKYRYIFIETYEKGLIRRLSQKETVGMN